MPTWTCKVEAEIRVNDKVVKSKSWPECAPQDEVVTAGWFATFGEAQGHNRIQGRLSGAKEDILVEKLEAAIRK